MNKRCVLVQISDCHLFADPDKTGYNHINPYYSLQIVMHRLAALQPDMLLVTGDISNDHSEQSYRHLLDMHQRYCPDTPLRLLVGNHDDVSVMQKVFDAEQLTSSTPLRLSNWQIHCLNTQTDEVSGYLSKEQREQVINNLAMENDIHSLIALHHPPILMDSWMDNIGLQNYQDVQHWLRQLPVKMALCGHVHSSKQEQIGQCLVMTCPSTCWQWGQGKEFSVSDEAPGFRKIELFFDGRWQSTEVRVVLPKLAK